MTCIVGITDGRTVTLGGDTQGTAGWSKTMRADTKVIQLRNSTCELVIGGTGSFRALDLVRYSLTLPAFDPSEQDPRRWAVIALIPAIRETFRTGGLLRTDNGVEDLGSAFLVGIRGRLFEVHSDLQVGEPVVKYAAVGCGSDIALGAMHATTGTPRAVLTAGLAAAATFSNGVGPDTTFVEATTP